MEKMDSLEKLPWVTPENRRHRPERANPLTGAGWPNRVPERVLRTPARHGSKIKSEHPKNSF